MGIVAYQIAAIPLKFYSILCFTFLLEHFNEFPLIYFVKRKLICYKNCNKISPAEAGQAITP